MATDYQRTPARVVRVGAKTTHLAIPAWCNGQITVSVLTRNVIAVTGLDHDQLPGAELVVSANLAAVTDTDIDVHAFQAAAPSDDSEPYRRRGQSGEKAPTSAGASAFLFSD
ncbi:hypothetical protein ACFZAR_43210 [Streptomyces sp. NPDC008222]|uniref:hypothetical protein n=1 Tax=Streptomyces sp. NPDC008222 TaxID=3364820 RepID=UPI0036E096B2